jgi:hypothetical protein
MTITPLSPSPITASVRRHYLTGTGHAPPPATLPAMGYGLRYESADRFEVNSIALLRFGSSAWG